MKWSRKKRNCIIVAAGLMIFILTGCSPLKHEMQLRSTGVAMGTVISISLYADSEEQGQEAVSRINECLKSLEEDTLSWRISGSEMWNINASAGKEGVTLSDEMYEYLEEVWRISGESGGALDVTIGQVTRLWNIDEFADAPDDFSVPGDGSIADALANTGYENIVIEKKLHLPEGMSLDLGAVGKGIACDEIKAVLEELQIPAAVISVGGSNITHGKKSDGTSWVIGIAHPRQEGAFLGYLSLEGDCFVATSGDYERYVRVEDKRYHHIMNPDTGYPADSGLCSVTIVSNNGLLSDALSTACFVSGKERGLELAEALGAEALLVDTDGNVIMTDGLRAMWLEE